MSPEVYSVLKSVSNAAFIISPALFIIVAIVIVYIDKKSAKYILIVSLLVGVFCSLGLVEKAGQSMVGGLIILALPLYICFWALSPPFFISAYMLYDKERRNYRSTTALLIAGLAILSINISYASIIPKKEASDRAFWHKVIRGDIVSLDSSEYQNHLSEEGRRVVEINLENGCKSVSQEMAGLLSGLGFDTSKCDDLPDNMLKQHIDAGSIIKEVKYEDYIQIKNIKDRVSLLEKIRHQKYFRKLSFNVSVDERVLTYELENIEKYLVEYPNLKAQSGYEKERKLPYISMFKYAVRLVAGHSTDQQTLSRIANIVLNEHIYRSIDEWAIMALFSNPDLPSDVLERLVIDDLKGNIKYAATITAATNNPNINDSTLKFFISSRNRNSQREALSSPHIKTNIIYKTLDADRDLDHDVLLAGLANLATREELSKEQLYKYLDKAFHVKRPSDRHKYYYRAIPESLLDILADQYNDIKAQEELESRKRRRT